jgi:hypothetical protein
MCQKTEAVKADTYYHESTYQLLDAGITPAAAIAVVVVLPLTVLASVLVPAVARKVPSSIVITAFGSAFYTKES